MSDPHRDVTIRLRRTDGYKFEVAYADPAATRIQIDEPPPLGEGQGPNPSQVLASAVAGCLGASLIERRIKSIIRWNAMAMVVRANRQLATGIGGHISTYASAATLYEVGLQPLLPRQGRRTAPATRSTSRGTPPGHLRPGLPGGPLTRSTWTTSARAASPAAACRPTRTLADARLLGVPDRVDGPRPDHMAIYQARFNRYLEDRGLATERISKVWAFLGDGEMDEPESAGRDHPGRARGLDNLIFVINCNLQRLDGPVRGNGKIIQELEAVFRGAGWNVIKVVWGATGTAAERDTDGAAASSAWTRWSTASTRSTPSSRRLHPRALLRQVPGAAALVETLTDEQLRKLRRGGHDPRRSTPPTRPRWSTRAAHGDPGQDDQGLRPGRGRRGPNITHQQKKLNEEELRGLPRPVRASRSRTTRSDEAPFYRPAEDSEEMRYLHERREALGGSLPSAHGPTRAGRRCPGRTRCFAGVLRGQRRPRGVHHHGLRAHPAGKLLRDKEIGKLVVPIVPDEARTFGMEALFRQVASTPRRPALRAGRQGQPAVLQGEPRRPDPRGGHHRGRLDGLLHRRRHGLRQRTACR
jgi:pyruvate dehydrogenase E1 component